jgi:hypothetical protein
MLIILIVQAFQEIQIMFFSLFQTIVHCSLYKILLILFYKK